ncbi:unnamed protein product [Orchesella dallaii]|uniref:Uncharacterized protein n=1 Tax=Orchesella dallaii TaxID=48710 RepID=A0ABP1QM01_9HEXA
MTSRPVHESRAQVFEAFKKLCQTREDMLKTVTKLLNEISNFKQKESLYNDLQRTYLLLPPSGTRQRLMYRATERKFSILNATSELFGNKRRQTLEKEMHVGKWVKPLLMQDHSTIQTLSEKELMQMIRKYQKGINAMGDLHKKFSDLETDWNQLKVEMHTMIDDCIRRMQELIS